MNSTIINLGPQHPAAHGVLRIILEVNGEYIKKIDSQIGFLHRGTEKLTEYRGVDQNLPYFDRLDYVSTINMENSYTTIIEQLFKINKLKQKNNWEIILMELTRISNHLLALTTNAMDIGAITPFLWAFEVREKICIFLEFLTGARLHVAVIRPGDSQIKKNITDQFIERVDILISEILDTCKKINNLLKHNKIWKSRLSGVGFFNSKQIVDYHITGPNCRGSGFSRDLRQENPWNHYNNNYLNNKLSYKNYIGDNFSRFNIRILEIFESIYIIQNIILKEKNNSINNNNNNNNSMEQVIKHFNIKIDKSFIKKNINNNTIYQPVETPKGEFSLIINKNDQKLYQNNIINRLKIRSPTFYSLNYLPQASEKKLITDFLAILASLDIVLDEVDR